jgi:ribosomal protein L37AE/L43A
MSDEACELVGTFVSDRVRQVRRTSDHGHLCPKCGSKISERVKRQDS